MTKICSKCGIEKEIEEYYIGNVCKICTKERVKTLAKRRNYWKIKYKNNEDNKKERYINYKTRITTLKSQRKASRTLSKAYIKRILTWKNILQYSDIPYKIIKQKRKELLLWRIIRLTKRVLNNQTNLQDAQLKFRGLYEIYRNQCC